MNNKIFIWLFILFTLSLSANALLNDSVAYYSFNTGNYSGNDIYDLSGNLNNGTNVGATLGTQPGILNFSADFQTSDYINTDLNGDITDYTISSWVYLDDAPTDDDVIFGSNNGATDRTRVRIQNGGNLNFLELRNSQTINEVYSFANCYATWCHVVVTSEQNGRAIVYINGTAVINVSTSNNDLSLGTADIFIGALNNGGAQDYWDGKIDEFSYYNRVWSSTEVLTSYNSGAGFNPYTTTPVSANFTITANDTDADSALTGFTVTIDGQTYNDVAGTVTTHILVDNGSLFNINISKTGYTTVQATNVNVSTAYVAQMTPLPLQDFTLTTPTGTNSSSTNTAITWTQAVSPASKTVTYTVDIQYPNGTLIFTDNTNSLSYNYNNTNLTIGLYQVNVTATEADSGDTFSHNAYFGIIPTQTYFQLGVKDYLNLSLLSAVTVQTPFGNYTNNPLTITILDNLNYNTYENHSIVLATITDEAYYHQVLSHNITFHRFMTDYNITMEANQLRLDFYSYDTPTTVKAVVHDTSLTGNSTYLVNATQILIIQQSLALGRVIAYINIVNETSPNWTQFYEYDNDFETHISETLHIIDNNDWSVNLKVTDSQVKDEQGEYTPLEDVTIRAVFSYAPNSSAYFLGQRITDDSGETYFYADSTSFVTLYLTKSGYNPIIKQIDVHDQAWTQDNPYEIKMTRNSAVNDSRTQHTCVGYANIDFDCIFVDNYHTTFKIQTAYRKSQGLPYRDVTSYGNYYTGIPTLMSILGYHPYTLTNGVDYITNSTKTSFYVELYLDDELWANKTYTIGVDTWDNENDIFTLTGLDSSYLNPLLAIVIIFASLIMGIIIQSSKAGIATFYIGLIVASFISTAFLWLTVIVSTLFILRKIWKVYSE